MKAEPKISLCYYLADQVFSQTKSLGIWNVSRELVRALVANSAVSRIDAVLNDQQVGIEKDEPKLAVSRTNIPTRSRLHRMYFDQFGIYRMAARIASGGLFLPKGFASFCATPPRPLFAYVHDVIPFEYARTYPGYFSRIELIYFQKSLLATFRHAKRIFTNSEFSKAEILRIALERRIAEPKVSVVGIGFDSSVRKILEKAQRILVLVGAAPHKNSTQSLDFMMKWASQFAFNGDVVIVGQLPKGLRVPDLENWRHLPRVAEEQFRQLFETSRVVVYFSEYEGFGMPVAEAVVCGVCPVYSSIPATREIIGDCKWAFKNESFFDFCRAMNAGLHATPSEIQLAANEVLRRLNWQAVAQRVVNGIVGDAEPGR